jgi:Arc/MetJ family transcription regulator
MVRPCGLSWCTVFVMARITVDVNEEWLDAAQEVLGTPTKVATINEALHSFAVRKQAKEIIAAFDSVDMDFAGSADAWGYGGGRDLSQLAERQRGQAGHKAA